MLKGDCVFEPNKYMYNLYADRRDSRFDAFFQTVYYCNKATNAAKTAYTWNATDAARYNLDESRAGNTAFDVALGDTIILLSRDYKSAAERNATNYAIYNIDDNYADEANPKRFFPTLIKGYCMIPDYLANPNKAYVAADQFIYRLGETYLVAAEIDYRLGDKASAAARLNTLRNRACYNHDGSLNVSAADITDDFLLDEYAREMIGEWNRWMTLKRFRAFESRLARCNPQVKSGSFVRDIHYVRPISSSEILLLDNAAEYQNKGY